MLKKTILFSLIAVVVIINCGSTLQNLPQPQQSKNLIIGSLIFEIDGYQNVTRAYRDNIEVAIVGRYVEDGQLKQFGEWITTDEYGYFQIANVPDGEYAIKGFRNRVISLGDLNIVNHLNDPHRNFYELIHDNLIGFNADIFDTKPQQRIINFQHNIFRLYQNEIVDHKRLNRLRDYKLSDGDVISEPPVPVYFIENYPESGWSDFLNMQM
ncbi:hypothetical protein GF337_13290 [candidate division KSB1 bacterium]|nr:hypothetical protein [candidate division KSB1 bacterium]